ncbi:FAD-binding oxidoreductase [Allokutzneria sp. A3M-2-11 16]|uniref:NAD(P)/FAD-dependent oxidoreductase n=1 Tax=Allokutzneria sp. A3M-2-11 16 TaxID=2962043 RepID=UPI0020B8F12A|nr:FAD-dependent oxidoreductase [Allokutzneria sp. A3M-2-11 16]MCP3802433.1 FAD-binding oxidoreductase [Allokutzneria sp. A3M-2-11 16]
MSGPGHRPPLTALTTDAPPASTEITVIGGGLFGAACAYWLSRSGRRVAVIEAGSLAGGASGSGAGLVVPTTPEPYERAVDRLGGRSARQVLRIAEKGFSLLRKATEHGEVDCPLKDNGHIQLAVGAERHAVLAERARALKADGVPTEWLSPRDLRGPVTTALAADVRCGLLLPGGVLDPTQLVLALTKAAMDLGATVHTGTAVIDVKQSAKGVRVMTTRGLVRSEAAIIAINAWSGRLVPDLDRMITASQAQVLATDVLPPVFSTGMSATIGADGTYWQQTKDGRVILGGYGPAASAQANGSGPLDRKPEDAVHATLVRALPRLFPAIGQIRTTQRRAAPVARTADHLPVVHRVDERVWAAGGFDLNGLPLAFALSRALALAVPTGWAPAELSPFALTRPSLRPAAV